MDGPYSMKQKKIVLNSIHVPDLMGATGVSLLDRSVLLASKRSESGWRWGLGEERWVGKPTSAYKSENKNTGEQLNSFVFP